MNYNDLGFDNYFFRTKLEVKEDYSAVDLDALIEPHSITEEMIDKALIDRLES